MHPRNPFANAPPDFQRLAEQDETLAKYLQFSNASASSSSSPPSSSIDFTDAHAVRALGQAILSIHFGLHVQYPEDRLCPPIPNRFDYLLWMDDVLRATSTPFPASTRSPRRTLDIGTGAAAIYPILACALDATWTFVATDIDEDSLRNAALVVEDIRNRGQSLYANHPLRLKERIQLMLRNDRQDLFPAEEDVDDIVKQERRGSPTPPPSTTSLSSLLSLPSSSSSLLLPSSSSLLPPASSLPPAASSLSSSLPSSSLPSSSSSASASSLTLSLPSSLPPAPPSLPLPFLSPASSSSSLPLRPPTSSLSLSLPSSSASSLPLPFSLLRSGPSEPRPSESSESRPTQPSQCRRTQQSKPRRTAASESRPSKSYSEPRPTQPSQPRPPQSSESRSTKSSQSRATEPSGPRARQLITSRVPLSSPPSLPSLPSRPPSQSLQPRPPPTSSSPASLQTQQQSLLPRRKQFFHSTMCNPPFYADEAEIGASRIAKQLRPSAVCTGSLNEVITPGGEVAFISRMIDESLDKHKRGVDVAIWYTSMLGKASSLVPLLQHLRAQQIHNVGVTELIQGRTKRWIVLWSLSNHRLPRHLIHIARPEVQEFLPPTTTISSALTRWLSGSEGDLLADVITATRRYVDDLPSAEVGTLSISGDTAASAHSLTLRFGAKTWNRAARRELMRRLKEGTDGDHTIAVQVEPVLCLTVAASFSKRSPGASQASVSAEGPTEETSPHSGTETGAGVQTPFVHLQWTYGASHDDFNSFATALLRRLHAGGEGPGKSVEESGRGQKRKADEGG